MGLPIFLGLIFAYFWPYKALALGQYSMLILMLLMFVTTISTESNFRSILNDAKSSQTWTGLFFCFLFIPACVWLLAFTLLNDQNLIYGIFWASLCPVALVAPHFVKKWGGDANFSFSLTILSSLLSPIFALLICLLFFPRGSRFQALPLFRDMLLMVSLPSLLGILLRPQLAKYFSSALRGFSSWAPRINMTLIGILSYSYMGAALMRLNMAAIDRQELWTVLAITLSLDFLLFILMHFALAPLALSEDKKIALKISLAMKNVAISGGLLLFDLPVASLASSLVFAAHGVFFTYLHFASSERKNYAQ